MKAEKLGFERIGEGLAQSRKAAIMIPLVIQCSEDAAFETCALCGEAVEADEGPQLFVADSLEIVCQDCGRQNSPPLAALLDLAREAQRTGRIRRHSVFPPLTALLDLARTAENFAHTVPHRCRQAA